MYNNPRSLRVHVLITYRQCDQEAIHHACVSTRLRYSQQKRYVDHAKLVIAQNTNCPPDEIEIVNYVFYDNVAMYEG